MTDKENNKAFTTICFKGTGKGASLFDIITKLSSEEVWKIYLSVGGFSDIDMICGEMVEMLIIEDVKIVVEYKSWNIIEVKQTICKK